jgi:hypothetical protein
MSSEGAFRNLFFFTLLCRLAYQRMGSVGGDAESAMSPNWDNSSDYLVGVFSEVATFSPKIFLFVPEFIAASSPSFSLRSVTQQKRGNPQWASFRWKEGR